MGFAWRCMDTGQRQGPRISPHTSPSTTTTPHRCDYIFYRALRERHRLCNRRCQLQVPYTKNTWLSDHFGILMDVAMHPLAADP